MQGSSPLEILSADVAILRRVASVTQEPFQLVLLVKSGGVNGPAIV